jgi:hypothetical protein
MRAVASMTCAVPVLWLAEPCASALRALAAVSGAGIGPDTSEEAAAMPDDSVRMGAPVTADAAGSSSSAEGRQGGALAPASGPRPATTQGQPQGLAADLAALHGSRLRIEALLQAAGQQLRRLRAAGHCAGGDTPMHGENAGATPMRLRAAAAIKGACLLTQGSCSLIA